MMDGNVEDEFLNSRDDGSKSIEHRHTVEKSNYSGTLLTNETTKGNNTGYLTYSKKRRLAHICPLKSKVTKVQLVPSIETSNLVINPSNSNEHAVQFKDLPREPVSNGSRLHINDIPVPLLLRIFSFVSRYDLLHGVCRVNTFWCICAHDPSLWRRLCLRKYKKVDNSVLLRLTSLSENVQYIDVSDTRLITSEGMVAALKNCSKLQVLKMHRCGNMDNLTDVFGCIAENCPEMRQLYLDGCYALKNTDLVQMSIGCPKLDLLRVNQCSNISSEGIKAVAKNCPRLVQITMDQCSKVNDEAIAALVKRSHKLEAISCMSCDLTDDGVAVLAEAKELKFLEISNIAQVRNASIMKIVKNCHKLESINVSLCRSINDACVEYIAKNGECIKKAHFVSCDLTDKALMSLGAYAKNLEIVDVGWCGAITDSGVRAISSTCKTLTYLGLMRCDKVTISTTWELVEQYPHITYSTKWLDCKRLLERAQLEGSKVTFPDPGPPPAPAIK